MKTLLWGLGVAVALAGLGSDASAGVPDEALWPTTASAAAHTGHGVMLAKAKKRRRPAPSAGKSAPAADDAAGGDDDAPSKSSSSDEAANEDELLGSRKKKKAAASDDGDASDSGGGEAAPAPRPRPKIVETVESKASSEEPEGEGSTATALEFGVGPKAMFRNFVWTAGGREAGLGPYSLTPGPEMGAWVEFYPAALGSTGFAANIGVIGRFNYGFGVATTLANGQDVGTTFRDFLGGLKVRIPIGTFVPNISLAYGQQIFQIAPQGSSADLPMLGYQFVRPALGARIIFAPTVALDLTAGYLAVLNPGSGANHIRSADYFPRATAYGIDVSASIAFRLSGAIGARGGIDWRQYGINLNPDASTPAVAGAVDRYIVASVGLEVVIDGQGAGAGGDDEPKVSKRKRRRAAEAKEDDESSDEESSSDKSSSDKSEDE